MARLERRLGCQLEDSALLRQALTHRSHHDLNNERLEFLGDSVLGFVVADWIYGKFPEISEGKLSRMRSAVVRRESLAQIARHLELPDMLLLGEGELKSGGFNRDSTLADTVEALIGAIYLDQGIDVVRATIVRVFDDLLSSLDPGAVYKDSKSKLQELLQKFGNSLPKYRIIATSGVDHAQEFEVSCEIENVERRFLGHGSNRRTAEQKAAQHAYEYLKQNIGSTS